MEKERRYTDDKWRRGRWDEWQKGDNLSDIHLIIKSQ